MREHNWFIAAANVVAQNVAGISAFIAGMAVTKW
jgi:hypothetical protein